MNLYLIREIVLWILISFSIGQIVYNSGHKSGFKECSDHIELIIKQKIKEVQK